MTPEERRKELSLVIDELDEALVPIAKKHKMNKGEMIGMLLLSCSVRMNECKSYQLLIGEIGSRILSEGVKSTCKEEENETDKT